MERLQLVTIKNLCQRQHTRIQTQKASMLALNQQILELKSQIRNLLMLNTELSEFIASECEPTVIFNPDPNNNNNNNFM